MLEFGRDLLSTIQQFPTHQLWNKYMVNRSSSHQAANIQTAFQLQHLVEAGHKNASCIDQETLKVIKSITDAQPGKDATSLRTPEWANTKEGFQKKVSSFLEGLAENLKVKELNLSDESDDSEEDSDLQEESEEESEGEGEEEYDSEYDSDEYTESEDERNTLDRISEDEDEDEGAEPKKCLDAKLGEGIILHEIIGRKVARYGNKVLKSGRNLRLSEADAMRYIATHTSIPVPRVLDAVTDGKLTSITMEYIEGDRLDKIWNSLAEEQKTTIVSQIHNYLTQLRNLTGKYIGGINRTPAIDSRRYDLEGGPFTCEAQFNDFLLSDAYPQVPKCFLTMAENSLRTNHSIVFAHGELAPRNILVREGYVVAVLDWEYAGWYPEYWDFVKSFNALDARCGSWYDWVGKVFPVAWEQEFMNDRFVGTLVRHGHS
ncbi:hypothetical protein sscle_04g036420 [Sclerotinia sclerotiorum 1980 UF-70]|uniref:Aminoglycoside phosphotransferase domain-containing protein n=1 Tax=Sclerotinia sclerotiorum (strain ATCC 18683 / 1980 / Ss-1) TaxID=665079 RepID=A0A1D9Q1Z9_SCLS1|nr:hypothetical protein sscle_04g036420 [Sclerotinia sclerotiorum 1980 UF-70]